MSELLTTIETLTAGLTTLAIANIIQPEKIEHEAQVLARVMTEAELKDHIKKMDERNRSNQPGFPISWIISAVRALAILSGK